jgi:hypothetical protein
MSDSEEGPAVKVDGPKVMQSVAEVALGLKDMFGDMPSDLVVEEPPARALRDLADTIVTKLGAAAGAPVTELDGDEAEVEATDPATRGLLGPNGHRIGYAKNGDMVEFIPDDEAPGGQWSIILRRNDWAVFEAYEEARDKVWWNRHQVWLEKIESGEEQLTCAKKEILKQAMKAAAAMEKKYGRENLGWDDFEWGELVGKMSALCWVLGTEWEESMDT